MIRIRLTDQQSCAIVLSFEYSSGNVPHLPIVYCTAYLPSTAPYTWQTHFVAPHAMHIGSAASIPRHHLADRMPEQHNSSVEVGGP